MQIYYLLICVTIEFVLALSLFKGDVLSPVVPFSLSFLISSYNLFLMKEYWDVKLDSECTLSITLGILVFIITCILVNIVSNRNNFIIKKHRRKDREIITVSKSLYPFLFIIYLITSVIAIIYVTNTARSHGASGNLGGLVGAYNGMLKSSLGAEVSYPIWIQLLSDFCVISSYIWAYVSINNYNLTKKIDKMQVVFFVFGIIISLEQGSRGDALQIIVATVCMIVFILRSSSIRDKKLSGVYRKIFILLIIIMLFFQLTGTMLGRDSNLYTPLEYISIYIGAPILNFNILIKRLGASNTDFYNYTFNGIYSSLGRIFGVEKWKDFHAPVMFLSSNGHRTGNVATAFSAFYYDAGILGCIVGSFFTALISQVLYTKAQKDETKGISVYLLLYSYFFFMIFRSFFANSVLNSLQLSLIKLVFFFLIEKKLLTRVAIKTK